MYFQHHVIDEHLKSNKTSSEDCTSYSLQNFDGQETTRHLNYITPVRQTYQPYKTYEHTFYDFCVEKCSIVEEGYFQGIIVTLIVLNSFQMGIATMDFVTDYPNTWELFHRVDILFMTIFTIEISMQFIYKGTALFKDVWLSSDLVLIFLTWIVVVIPWFREFRVLGAFRLIVK